MTNEELIEEDLPVVRVCVACGHGEDDHVDQDLEVAGATVRRTYCGSCEEWHDFAPGDE